MAVYRCLLCYPTVKEHAVLGNMKSHLGATTLAGHNMGPFRCQVPSCTKRAVRDDNDTRHGTPSHAPDWIRDQALADRLDTLAQQCQFPWAPQFAPATCEPNPLATTQGPPVAAQGHHPSAPAPAQGSLTGFPIAAAQVSPVTAQTSTADAQDPPAAAQEFSIIAQAPASVTPPAQVPFVACPFTPPTNYFEQAMDEFERRYAGMTREDIEQQYEEEQELYYQ